MGARTVLLALILTASGACSSVPPNLFTPPAPPIGRAHVELHYLGSGGWVLRRGEDRIVTAPYVTNTPAYRIAFPARRDTALIDEVVPTLEGAHAILVGHGHYDHAFDLPYVATAKARGVPIYGGATVVNMLAAVPELREQLRVIQPDHAATGSTPGQWLPRDPRAVRFMPLTSTHAPHFLGLKLAPWWRVTTPQASLPWSPLLWKEGETYAYLIDFLDRAGGRPVFRIYYQDSASHPRTGIMPDLPARDAAPVDVAILCVASFSQVDDYPEHILRNVKPRAIVGGHWEDFLFRAYGSPARPVPLTSVETFHRRARAVTPVDIYLPEPGQKLSLPIVE